MKTFFAATIALSMLAAPAMAAPYDAGHAGKPGMGQSQGHPGSQQKPQTLKPIVQKPVVQKPAPKPQYSYNGRKYDAVRGPAWNAPRGYDAHRNWNRGQKLPAVYRNKSYVVDYRAYHLKKPAYGYQWVRINNNVYLVKANNGLVSQIVFNLFY
ncbi:MAG: RcnB family protein [Parvibaculum sp.]|uniref:RcnB family protein n=1 Tax=Parvibaculum sp. TaxID=2024848 RepID=UPI0025ED0722|nr:RcnB family protein [Parvibaculum sp.]MCE9648199.1 RcnB family protein [Parvibaculum sp.]